MKNLIAAIAITLALAVSAFAQNESQHCYVRDGYHICEFQPSGRVNVSWGDADDYHSLWYTAKTWPAAHAHLKKIWERDDAEVQAFACSQKRIAPDLDTGEAEKLSTVLRKRHDGRVPEKLQETTLGQYWCREQRTSSVH